MVITSVFLSVFGEARYFTTSEKLGKYIASLLVFLTSSARRAEEKLGSAFSLNEEKISGIITRSASLKEAPNSLNNRTVLEYICGWKTQIIFFFGYAFLKA